MRKAFSLWRGVTCIILLLLFFAQTSYSSEPVILQFLYLDPSTDPNMCWECPSVVTVYNEFREKSSIIDRIEDLYGAKVRVERIDFWSPEGQRLTGHHGLLPQAVVANHEIKIQDDAFTEEGLREVIDACLAGRGADPGPVQPFTIVGAFSLGLFETLSPCLVAMLSFILSYTMGATSLFRDSALRVMVFGAGFVSAAVLLGAAVALTFAWMPSFRIMLMWIICIFALIFGLGLLGLLRVPIHTKPLVKKLAGEFAATYMGLLLLGFVFYFLDPCIAPFAFTMLIMLQSVELILPLLAFCLGAILPFVGIAVVSGSVSKWARSTYKHRLKIRAVSGCILLVYAIYLIVFHLL